MGGVILEELGSSGAARGVVGRVRQCVLVLEGDRQLLDMIAAELARNGYDVLRAAGEHDLKALLVEPKFELAIIDLALDGAAFKGLDLVREIRDARNVPIIAISGHAQPWDRLRALEMGIDDYITKPFLLKELLIRIERLFSIYKAAASGTVGHGRVFVFSGFQLDPVRRIVQTAEGQPLHLTETEFNILRFLVYASGRIVRRDELWQALRGLAWSPLDRALDGHVARLRAKLEPRAERPQIIKSARGIGYVLAVPVTCIPA